MHSSASRTLAEVLADSGLAAVDARILLGHVMGRDRAWLAAHTGDVIDGDMRVRFETLARMRRDGEPVAYLIGRREFYGLDLEVGRGVLIPRPETETAVEVALLHLPPDEERSVLDLGTGSGAIALALASQRPRAGIVATDVSPAALAIAARNAQRLGLSRVRFVCSDWWSALHGERFDVIVSNPPYVASGDPHLREGDLRFEPALALDGGAAGLAAIDAIVSGAASHLKPPGMLVIEHGFDQAEAIGARFAAAGFRDVIGTRDLAGIIRVTAGRVAG